ncbi:MAG: DNA phosphorothioation-associated putative methyltransferase, partial [Shewanella sp.]
MITVTEFTQAVETLTFGKKLPEAIYLHRQALEVASPRLYQFSLAIANALKVNGNSWNIIKVSRRQFALSLLNYPSFYTEAYPALNSSISIDLSKLSHRVLDYTDSDNPPILHRKELLVLTDDPHYNSFKMITVEGEAAGLYENTRLIGFKSSWEAHIAKHGYILMDGRLFRASMLPDVDQLNIDRHKTALVRHSLSSPMKSLAKLGFFNGNYSIFDYGCGRGDDLRELQCHGLDVLGWDPNHFPEGDKKTAAIVNLGFVLNVIEDKHERLEALFGAWELAEKLLVVSVMLANDEFIAKFTPYKDGVITSRNTFQKYYKQAEIKSFIERSLDESSIAIAPGIFYIFKDKVEEQQFLSSRYRRNQQWKQLSSPPSITQGDKARFLVAKHQELFATFWQTVLDLGRLPKADEFEQFTDLKKVTDTPVKALR